MAGSAAPAATGPAWMHSSVLVSQDQPVPENASAEESTRPPTPICTVTLPAWEAVPALRTTTCADTFPPSTGVPAGPDTDTAKSSGGSAPMGMFTLASLLLVLSSPALTKDAVTWAVRPE